MNKYERKMLDILQHGRDTYGVVATKAEFEAEGTRTDELLRLLEIAHKAEVGLALKIGGCEAVRDLFEAKQFGVRYVIAPMVETDYALSKFIAAKDRVFSQTEQDDVTFMFNVETETSYNNLESLANKAAAQPGCDGIVFGRVDYSSSLGLGRGSIESEQVTSAGEAIARICRSRGLQYVVGGAISIDALTSLRRINAVHLDRFETRKIVFQASALGSASLAEGLRQAVHFELLWLLNKQEYYGMMHKEDEARIQMLENRWNVLNG